MKERMKWHAALQEHAGKAPFDTKTAASIFRQDPIYADLRLHRMRESGLVTFDFAKLERPWKLVNPSLPTRVVSPDSPPVPAAPIPVQEPSAPTNDEASPHEAARSLYSAKRTYYAERERHAHSMLGRLQKARSGKERDVAVDYMTQFFDEYVSLLSRRSLESAAFLWPEALFDACCSNPQCGVLATEKGYECQVLALHKRRSLLGHDAHSYLDRQLAKLRQSVSAEGLTATRRRMNQIEVDALEKLIATECAKDAMRVTVLREPDKRPPSPALGLVAPMTPSATCDAVPMSPLPPLTPVHAAAPELEFDERYEGLSLLFDANERAGGAAARS
jgi:hypothetical protein